MLAELIKLHTQDKKTHFGALYNPDGKPKVLGVVFVHGMTGSFVGEMESVTPGFVAKAGYVSLVANNRGTGYSGAATEDFAGCIYDIRSAIDFMAARGLDRIALLGHSKGGVKVAYYFSQTGDPRVACLGLLSPAENVHGVPVWMAKSMGYEDIEQLIPTVRELVENGQGEKFLSMPEWPYFVSAKTFLDHYSVHGDSVLPLARSFTLPVLALCGEQELDWCKPVASLTKKHAGNVRVEIIPGADHVYTNREAVVAGVIVDWLDGLPFQV
jgi:alpha-beta hydrolase superfamily lysophospholipase